MKKLLSSDPITGKKTYYHSSNEGDHVTTEVDTKPVLDAAKEQANEWRYGSMIGNTQKHRQKIGEFSSVVYYDLLEKFGQPKDNPKAWMKWLEQNKAFKATGGKLI
jgi:hypothetical protein